MTSEQLEQLAQLVANKIQPELTKPTENITFHKKVDMFGNDSDIAINSPLPANIEEWNTMSLLSKKRK